MEAATKGPAKKHSIAANDEAARALAERRKVARAAAGWVHEHGVGSKAALKQGRFKDTGVTYNIKMTEDTIQGHFYSEFGLEAELVDAGIMDPESKVIKDPRRVLNSDETWPRRRLEDQAKEAAAKEKKRLALEKKESATQQEAGSGGGGSFCALRGCVRARAGLCRARGQAGSGV